MYQRIKLLLSLIVIPLFFVACSTKKNTAVTRFYHNLTSHYNILFNGTESYKQGMLKLINTYDDDFTKLLPVFLYYNADALSNISSEMDRAIKKATKLVSMHSLTVKPEIDPDKEMSQKQKEFYSKREFNKYVDDAYLLMGKAHFYTMDYSKASETFNYIITNYPQAETIFETRLWLARLAIVQERYREAEDILSAITRNIEFPKHLKGDLHATWADYYLKQNLPAKALDELIIAQEHTADKSLRERYTYLIAQLFALTGNNAKATEYYGKVIKMNPPYKMTFSAKINRALVYQGGTGTGKDIEKQLEKMLRDDKNIEYQDQIYYALGNINYKSNQETEAIEFYKKSLETSTDNLRQKAKTNLTLADIYYDKPNYLLAQAYYDSAVAVIDTDYPDYQTIYAKSISLNDLVENIRTVEFEDSVLKLAQMPDPDLMDYIDNLIEEEIKAEEERRMQEEYLAQQKLDNMMSQNEIASSSGGWYFYNQAAKTQGKKEFLSTWGNRKLEDNWRRKNKSTITFEAIPDEELAEETTVSAAPGEIVTNKRSREYYLQYIPFSDSAKEIAHTRIAESLIEIGDIYSDELKDYPEAIDAYEELLKRYPAFDKKLQVYYSLYNIAKETRDIERVSKYQQRIVSEFPNSNYAKLMTNPNYLQELKSREQEIYNQYTQVLNLYNSKNYPQSAYRAKQIMEENPGHELIPKFDYIYTVSTGLRKDTLSFVKDLQALVAKYPGTEIALNAEIMVKYLQTSAPEVVQEQNLEIAREIFKSSFAEPHYFAFITPKAVDINQLIFNIINFNLEFYDQLKLEVKRENLAGNQLLVLVQQFGNGGEAMAYFNKINRDNNVFRDVDNSNISPVVISRSNFELLKGTDRATQYLLFFKENYK